MSTDGGKLIAGATHDAKAWHTSGLSASFAGRLHRDDGPGLIGDAGYTGLGILTPYRKPAGGQLSDRDQDINKQISSERACVERAIAHLKNWKILATGYRGPDTKLWPSSTM